MILLFLGLALVPTMGSSLLDSSSGREDEERDFSRSSNGLTAAGQISGSCSLTANGDFWLTILIDDFSILAKIDVIDDDSKDPYYRFSLSAIEYPEGSACCFSPQLLPHAIGQKRIVEFKDSEDATSKILEMFKSLGIAITDESLKSIPYAITCGWRSPKECRKIVKRLIKENTGK